MSSLVQRSFGFYLTILQFLGYYPPEKYNKFYSIYACSVYCCFAIPIPALATVNLLLTEDLNLEKISESAFIICQMYGFILKQLPFVIKARAIRRSVYMIESPIFTSYNKRQKVVIDECVKTCKRNCCIFLTSVVCAFTSWAVTPFFGDEMKFPVDVWLPFNVTEDPRIFRLIFIIIVIGVGNGAHANAVIDTLLSGLLCHAKYQMKILKNNLRFLSESAEEETVENNIVDNVEKFKNSYVYDKISECVLHHNLILQFIATFEDVYSLVVISQFMASTVVVCISCLQLSMLEPLSFPFFAMISFVITMLTEIYFYCYYGTALYEESNTLANSVYTAKWYTYDSKCKKALIIFMERSKKPIILTAGKILDLSLDTFTTILKRAYSLFAVLQNQ